MTLLFIAVFVVLAIGLGPIFQKKTKTDEVV